MRYAVKSKARKRREAEYQVTLHSYAQILRPGVTRKEVESYLRAKDLKFQQMCCVELRKHSLDDLVKIGSEDPPWYCSENNVYIAFQFEDSEKSATKKMWVADDQDKLRAVTEFRWLETCL